MFASLFDMANANAPAGFSDRLYAEGLHMPTAMEFTPDGQRLFVSEKDGDLRVINEDGELLDTPFVSIPVDHEGERGLLGIAFDPDFESNGYVYVYYTTDTDPVHSKVSRFTADPENPNIALEGSEFTLIELESLATASHVGGAIEFGPDGTLYISVGDNHYPYHAQSLTSRFGKILRINADGTIPAGNPFYNVQGAYGEIWALGLRNPFTFQFSQSEGRDLMYIADVGQNSWEEVNVGLAGANYGWPRCEGFCNDPQFVDPVYSYQHDNGASIIGGPFYEADQFPQEYLDSYFFGDYVQGFVSRLTPDNHVEEFLTDVNTPVAMEVGADGRLYYLSIAAGQVRTVQHTTPGNYDPIAIANANQTSGLPPLAVAFDGSESTDPNSEDTLSYSWDFGDGSDAVSGAQVTHVYDATGPYVATLTVDDGRGGISSDSIDITVGSPPVGAINAPAEGATYSAGDTISFSGSASDSEGEDLPASAYEWVILFHHAQHTHPFQEYAGVTSGNFTIPPVGETDDDVWYRIYLTVTDSSGLTHESTRDILPNRSNVTLASNVDGLEVLLDGQPHSAPHSFVGVVGVERTFEAPPAYIHDGQFYTFESWSDDDSNNSIGDNDNNNNDNTMLTVQTPPEDTTFTAIYNLVGDPPEGTLTVTSTDLSGDTITGYYVTVMSDGVIVEAGYTPLTFAGTEGLRYSVTMHDYAGVSFDHWDDGSVVRTRTLTLEADTEVTALYRTAQDTVPSTYNLSVRSADMSGDPLPGISATIEDEGGEPVQTGYTPLVYIGEPGESYSVTVQDQDGVTFDSWEDGSTERTRTVTLDSDVIVTAHFETDG